MRVKVCGAVSELDLRVAKLSGADAVGVISPAKDWPDYQKSTNSHTVITEQALWLRESLPDGLEFVWLPRRTTDFEEITDFARLIKPDRIQIGETEVPELAIALHEHYADDENTPKVAQVVHVADEPVSIEHFADKVDYIHLDSAGERFGGNGISHDWKVSAEIAEQAHAAGTPVILAGGLTVANVAEAIAIVQPDEVDVESSIRSSFGAYSQIELQRFVQEAHEAGALL